MANAKGLSEIELVWLIAWNLAAGFWTRVGLGPVEAKRLMFDFVRRLDGDLLEAGRESRVRLQQALMALHGDSFEKIQDEAPFRPHAWQNMHHLLRGFKSGGDVGIAEAWRDIFQDDREAQPDTYEPIRVVGGDGRSEERALEVLGAPNQETRVAGEWWYLRYTLGHAWTPAIHMTTTNANGEHFSVHDIRLADGSQRQIFFRLPW